MIVAYDINRGEPKHRLDKKAEESIKTSGTLPVLNFGDCVDCHRCVTVCPTGIDIRDGSPMECVNCTQCMDACDEVMHKIGRQPGLIRYSSKAIDEGKAKKLLRARSVIYPVLLLGLLTLFTIILLQKQEFSATLIRGTGNQFAIEDLNVIRNQLKLRITNRRNSLQSYSIQVISEGVAIAGDLDSIEIESGKTKVIVFSASAPFEKFSNGRYPIQFEINDKLGGHQVLDFKLLGPKRLPRRQTTTN